MPDPAMPEPINHVTRAKRYINHVHDWQELEGETDATRLADALLAQTEATLALAEQARVRNLIALASIAYRADISHELAHTAHRAEQKLVEMGRDAAPYVPDAICVALGVRP